MTDLGPMMIKAAVKYCLKDLTVMPLHLTTELFTHVVSYLCSVPKSHSSSSPCCAKMMVKEFHNKTRYHAFANLKKEKKNRTTLQSLCDKDCFL